MIEQYQHNDIPREIFHHNKEIIPPLSEGYVIDHSNKHLPIPPQISYVHLTTNEYMLSTLPNNITHLSFGGNINEDIILPPHIKYVQFGYGFDRKVILPQGIRGVIFGYQFNQPIILPSSIEHVEFGYEFNHPIIIPRNVKLLTFGCCFNQKVKLPDGLKTLSIEGDYNQSTILPHGLQALYFKPYVFDHQLHLPLHLEHLCFNCYQYGNNTITLPKSLVSIHFNTSSPLHIELPHHIKIVVIGHSYNVPIIIPNGAEHVVFGHSYDHPVILSPSIRYLKCGDGMNSAIFFDNAIQLERLIFCTTYNMPTSLVNCRQLKKITFGHYFDSEVQFAPQSNQLLSITFGQKYNKDVILPPYVASVKFGDHYNRPTILNDCYSLRHLKFGRDFDEEVKLPINLVSVVFGYSFNRQVELPINVKSVTFGYCFNQPMDLGCYEQLTFLNFEDLYTSDIILPPNLQSITIGNGFSKLNITYPSSIMEFNKKWTPHYIEPQISEQLMRNYNIIKTNLFNFKPMVKHCEVNKYNVDLKSKTLLNITCSCDNMLGVTSKTDVLPEYEMKNNTCLIS